MLLCPLQPVRVGNPVFSEQSELRTSALYPSSGSFPGAAQDRALHAPQRQGGRDAGTHHSRTDHSGGSNLNGCHSYLSAIVRVR